jgi:lysophospholipase L1-like esterase
MSAVVSKWFWIALFPALVSYPLADSRGAWIGTWQSSPAGLPTETKIGSQIIPVPTTLRGTIRYRLRISQGGSRIRVRVSNEYGKLPQVLTSVTVGIAADGLDAIHGTLKRVSFGGNDSIVIPPGAPALSDPIDLPLGPLSDILVSIYMRDGIAVFACTSLHTPADQIFVEGSNAVLMEHMSANGCAFTLRPIVSEIDVLVDQPRKVIVAFGDSITDGSVDLKTGDRGWPGALSRRLRNDGMSVTNAGIAGNRLLESMSMFGASALSRFDQDVLSVPGVSHIIFLEGINDIGMSGVGGLFGESPLTDPRQLISAYLQIVARARERGIQVFGATMLPFCGSDYYSSEKESVRESINDWIRTSKSFDGVIDFDAVVRDPTYPCKLKIEYDIGDHLHPNSAGYEAMSEMIAPTLFK